MKQINMTKNWLLGIQECNKYHNILDKSPEKKLTCTFKNIKWKPMPITEINTHLSFEDIWKDKIIASETTF